MHTDHTRPQAHTQAQGAQSASEHARTISHSRQAYQLPNPTQDLKSAYVELLSRFRWDLYGTLTFREDTHPESAYKRFRLFISMINRKLYGPRWAKHHKGVSYCVALERQRRGVVHFHCLLADPEITNLLKGGWFKKDGRWANELMESWNELAGFARIEPIGVLEAVEGYVSKYVLKGGEIDLGGPLMQQRLQLSCGAAFVKPGPTSSECLGKNSDSVPALPALEVKRVPQVGEQLTIASTFLPLEAWGARRSDLVEWARKHGASGGADDSRECASSVA